MARRAKRVSKAYGTKMPSKTTRQGLPAKGVRARSETTRAMTRGKTGVKVLSGQAAFNVGRPGFGGRVPGPVDGKDSVRRLMVHDPKNGLESPAANKITNTHVDIVGPVNPKVVAQPLPGSPSSFGKGGRKVIAAPRKSKPTFSNKPGRVRRSPGS